MQSRTITTPTGPRQVSALCLGAMNFGTSTDADTSRAVLDRFVGAGGTFIDTANNYNQWVEHGGESERLLGEWFRDRGNRDDIVVATKCGAKAAGEDPNADWEGLTADAIKAAVAASLERLGTDRIDLYYAHIDDRDAPLEETVDALSGLVTAGQVGAVGCSNYMTWRLERARNHATATGGTPYTVIQQEFSYLWPKPYVGTRAASDELRDYVSVHDDMTIAAYSPVLAGVYGKVDRPVSSRPTYAHASSYQRLETLRQVANELGVTPNQLVLAWLMHQPCRVVPIVGASSVAQLDEALGAVDVQLDDEVVQRLNTA